MIISYTHKFIFIHVYKVAGNSVRNALEPYTHFPEDTLLGKLGARLGLGMRLIVPAYKAKQFEHHTRAAELKRELPSRIYDGFYKFAFVRNPWDWQVSMYFWMIRDGGEPHKQRELVKKMSGFEEYIEWRIENDLRLQKEFLVDEDGRLLVDFVGHFERINEDFRKICQVLGLSAELSHLNATPHRDYRSYYSARTRKLVEESFREDIELFGYQFDGLRDEIT